jgi:hypothetical protein
MDQIDKLLQEDVAAPTMQLWGVFHAASSDLDQRDRYRLAERITELLKQHPDMGDTHRDFLLSEIEGLLEIEKVEHIKSFTRKDRFFDIVQMARDSCLRPSTVRFTARCTKLELLAPEGYWVAFAQQETEPNAPDMEGLAFIRDRAKETGVKLHVPATNDRARWKEWLQSHQDLRALWLDDSGLQKLRSNPSLLNHF